MKTTLKDLAEFKYDDSFYPEIKLLITIKSFNLKEIRDRYLKNKNKKSNRTGSVERRKSATGGIAEVIIKKGEIIKMNVLKELTEPRGIDFHDGTIAFSSENKACLINNDNINCIENPWFSYIHTLDIDKNKGNKILISSSGFDCIFEYDINKLKKTFEWFAWENGFDHGRDPETGEKVYLTRNKTTANKLEKAGKKYIYISDPGNQKLPTARRSAFINSVVYNSFNDNIIATFFHEGAVFSINKQTGKAEKVLSGLKSPHGGMQLSKDEYLATSTAHGEVVTGNTNNETRFLFKNLSGKPSELNEMEWIQNSKMFKDIIISIDSNRNSFVIFNPEKNLISRAEFNPNWAVQDMAISDISEKQREIIKNSLI